METIVIVIRTFLITVIVENLHLVQREEKQQLLHLRQVVLLLGYSGSFNKIYKKRKWEYPVSSL